MGYSKQYFRRDKSNDINKGNQYLYIDSGPNSGLVIQGAVNQSGPYLYVRDNNQNLVASINRSGTITTPAIRFNRTARVTGDYTVQPDDFAVIVDASGAGSITLTLPSPTLNSGQFFFIKHDTSEPDFLITFSPVGLADEFPVQFLNNRYDSRLLFSDGQKYHIVGNRGIFSIDDFVHPYRRLFIGTSGTNVSWVSKDENAYVSHTLHIPDIGATAARGLMTHTAQGIGGHKTLTGGITVWCGAGTNSISGTIFKLSDNNGLNYFTCVNVNDIVSASMNKSGELRISATPACDLVRVGGVLHTNVNSSGNNPSFATDLYSYIVPANALKSGDSIKLEAGGVYQGTPTKRWSVYLGSDMIFDTDELVLNSFGDYHLELDIFAVSLSGQRSFGRLVTTYPSSLIFLHRTSSSVDLRQNQNLRLVATTDGNLSGTIFRVSWHPTV